MLRLKNRAQFQAVLAGAAVARSGHFVLHRLQLPTLRQQTPSPGHNAQAVLFNKASLRGLPASVNASIGTQRFSTPLFGVSGSWLGAMVPKRWAKRAVTRNMIKRRIYAVAETVRCGAATDQEDAAYVVRLRSAFDPRLFKSATSAPLRSAVSQELSSLFAQGFRCD